MLKSEFADRLSKALENDETDDRSPLAVLSTDGPIKAGKDGGFLDAGTGEDNLFVFVVNEGVKGFLRWKERRRLLGANSSHCLKCWSTNPVGPLEMFCSLGSHRRLEYILLAKRRERRRDTAMSGKVNHSHYRIVMQTYVVISIIWQASFVRRMIFGQVVPLFGPNRRFHHHHHHHNNNNNNDFLIQNSAWSPQGGPVDLRECLSLNLLTLKYQASLGRSVISPFRKMHGQTMEPPDRISHAICY
jgi:hypothetical protein